MFKIKNKKLREFCAPVIDVEYVVGDNSERPIERLDQIIAIAAIYYAYNSETFEDENGKHPYIVFGVDCNNIKFAKLETKYIEKAGKIKNPRYPKVVSLSLQKGILRNIKNIADPDSTDACNKLDNLSLIDIVANNMDQDAMYNVRNESGNTEFLIPEDSRIPQYENAKALRDTDLDNLQSLIYLIKKSTCQNCLFEKYDTSSVKLSRFYKN